MVGSFLLHSLPHSLVTFFFHKNFPICATESGFSPFSEPCSQDFFLNAFFLFTIRYRWASRRYSQCCLIHANNSRCYLRWSPNVSLTITSKLSTILPPTCLTSFCGCPNLTPAPFHTSIVYILLTQLHSLLLASPRILYLLKSASSLRETAPLAYITFNYLIFIHKVVIWIRYLTICKPSFEDLYRRQSKGKKKQKTPNLGVRLEVKFQCWHLTDFASFKSLFCIWTSVTSTIK